MTDRKQSDGREQNVASPVEDWESTGVLKTKEAEEARKREAENKSFAPKDLTGPAGDPAEGKRPERLS